MSKTKPKLWIIRNRGFSHISHRALSAFEVRNPTYYGPHAAFETWAEAQAELIRLRTEDLAKARRDLKNAERALARVTALKGKP